MAQITPPQPDFYRNPFGTPQPDFYKRLFDTTQPDFYKHLFGATVVLDTMHAALDGWSFGSFGPQLTAQSIDQITADATLLQDRLTGFKSEQPLQQGSEKAFGLQYIDFRITSVLQKTAFLKTLRAEFKKQSEPSASSYSLNTSSTNSGIHAPLASSPSRSTSSPSLYSTTNSSTPSHMTMSTSTPIPRQPVSFTIIETGNKSETQTPTLTPLQRMGRIAHLLHNGQDQQGLKEFSTLPASIQKSVYEALWFVRGKPTDGNPIAHLNFGEVSFKNQDQRCFSSPQQKACAVELIKGQAALHTIIDAFEKGDTITACQIFNDLPPHIQNEIYGKHWVQMGKPTDQSSDEALKKIAHPNFGKVSLLGLETRCNVTSDKKAATMKAYLADYKSKIKTIQEAVDQIQKQWPAIDQDQIQEEQKNESKKGSLDTFAQNTVPFFLDVKSVTRPSAKGESYHSLAEAYAETYPCLRPFLLQLIPTLKVASDPAIQGTLAHDMPKSSQAVQINLSSMPEPDRKAYRTGIMNETLETLQCGYYINSKGQKIALNLKPAAQSLHRTASAGNFKRPGPHQTQIFLDNKDCLTVTRDCANRGLSTLVLDVASDNHFGGDYKTGAGAQEENICRRSGLCFAADTTLTVQTRNFYPLSNAGPAAGLYVANVPVFRGEEGEGYPFLDQPFETAVAIMAAHNFNEEHQKKNGVPDHQLKKLGVVDGEYRLPAWEAVETKMKLQTIFQMAANNNHDCVMLVALGCNAFHNPPKHFVELAMEAISQNFPNSFKEIHFAVIDDPNMENQHNLRGNYTVIKETLENKDSQHLISTIGAKFTVT